MASKLRNTFTELALLDCKDGVVHYIPTQLKGLDGCQITFLCSPTALSRMEDLLTICAENPISDEKYLEHIERMEARYMTEIEEREVDILEVLQDKHNDYMYSVYADSTYNGIRYLKRTVVTGIASLTSLWRISSKGCYFDIDTEESGLRGIGSKYYHNQFNLKYEPAEELNKRLKSMFEFECGNHVLDCIVRALYIIMSNPYGKGSERLALTYLENALPTSGIPIAKCLSADYNNFYDILNTIWEKDSYDCIDITKYVSYMIDTICKAAKLFNTITKELSKDCLVYIPEDGIKKSELESVLESKLYNPKDIIEMYLDAEYIMERPTGYIVRIYKQQGYGYSLVVKLLIAGSIPATRTCSINY